MSIENKINWLPFYTKTGKEAIQLLNKPRMNWCKHDEEEEELIQMPPQQEGIDWEWYANDMRKIRAEREKKTPLGVILYSDVFLILTVFVIVNVLLTLTAVIVSNPFLILFAVIMSNPFLVFIALICLLIYCNF
jgi:hypothetical protein